MKYFWLLLLIVLVLGGLYYFSKKDFKPTMLTGGYNNAPDAPGTVPNAIGLHAMQLSWGYL